MKPLTHRIPGLILKDHHIQVPLDYTRPDGEQITVFAREISRPSTRDKELPMLVFLQGGPGFASPRPLGDDGWIKRALDEYRLVLLDQRGTGRSTPVSAQSLRHLQGPEQQAAYLAHFRADNIVRDAEELRRRLCGDEPWSILGQSFGGFCAMTYLSFYPQGLREAFFTGGLPPLDLGADEVYRATYKRAVEKNKAYFERYPGDRQVAAEVAAALHAHSPALPNGDRLSVRRFQQLGTHFGGDQGFEIVHYLLENALLDNPAGREINQFFLREFAHTQPFDAAPIYAILHEAIYCQGQASNWSAQRVRAEYPQFDWSPGGELLFTGEMVYPWMFDDHHTLAPLKDAAEILAGKADWPNLYDLDTLAGNQVPCAAVVYYADMYVERAFSERTAALVPNLRIWVTNEYEHSGLRVSGGRVLERLFGMAHGIY